MLSLIAGFFLAALLYASVGFGGGSTYNALLALSGVDFRILPSIALICNIIVVSGGTWQFGRAGHIPWSRIWPILVVSAPCAWLGGQISVSQQLFTNALGAALFFAGILMLLQNFKQTDRTEDTDHHRKTRWITYPIGMVVGFASGIVGIGGGIFLAPILHFTRWAKSREIAGSASIFILVNSIAGLFGQFRKLAEHGLEAQLVSYWPLALSVLIGGQIGSVLGAKILPLKWVRGGTAALILYVAFRLIFQS